MKKILVTHSYLSFPIQDNGPVRKLTVVVDGKAEPPIDIQLADGTPDWWAYRDVSSYKDKEITWEVDHLPEGSLIEQGDEIKNSGNLYHEPLRPQFHFSSKRGWLNDPNGLVFFRGEYHLFYQHNPYGWSWGNMHWGHAVSSDLVHWRELGEALYPDETGTMFSGSAVVDWKNSSGLGNEGQPPLVILYTAAGKLTTQCMAYSLDGRTITKCRFNPILKQIEPGNRDPKVIWYEPTQSWVMVLYIGLPTLEKDDRGQIKLQDTVYFFSSPNLKDWTLVSKIPFAFECPDLFELPMDGDVKNKKWVLIAATTDYLVGAFDGTTFTPETAMLRGQCGGSYAAQTYSDSPDGRRIHIGWLQANSPGMPFNQVMSLPLELNLVKTPEGPRLTWKPVRELERLRGKTQTFGPFLLKPDDTNPLLDIHGELMEIHLQFNPGEAKQISLNVRGLTISYDAVSQKLMVKDKQANAPLRGNSLNVIIYIDRISVELFGDDGLIYMALAFIPKQGDRSVSLNATGGSAKIDKVEIYHLNSAW